MGQNERERAEWLLDRGADPNTCHAYTRQPLHAVAQLSGFLDLQRLLEGRGARPVALTGIDALQAASRRHDAAAVRALAAAEPAFMRDPRPLLAAAMFGDAEAVDLLLEFGADVHALDGDGISALHRAVQSGSLPVVDRLLRAGADPNLRDGKWRGTALSWAKVLGRPQLNARLIPLSRDVRALASLPAVERLEAVLRTEPALANDRLEEDDAPTPLYCLPDDDDLAAEVARILLRHGADPGVRNAKGRTPADVARSRGLEEAAELIETAHRAA